MKSRADRAAAQRTALAVDFPPAGVSALRLRLPLSTPKLLFLDEPTSGVDPTTRRAFWKLIYQLVGEGITALVTTLIWTKPNIAAGGYYAGCRLLAMDTPSELKARYLQGAVWDIVAQPLLPFWTSWRNIQVCSVPGCPEIISVRSHTNHWEEKRSNRRLLQQEES